VAEQLTASVRETLGMDAVSLFAVELPACPILHEIMEAVGQADTTPRNHAWWSVDLLVASEFGKCNDLQGVVSAIAQSKFPAGTAACPPFARLGWFDDLKQWVEQAIEPLGLRLNGRFRQLNARPAFSLIRFETNGPAVWFKAVGEPNLREYSITLMLARLASPFLPSLIAVRPEWNGWLAFEAEGTCHLDDSKPCAWLRAAHDLARLQIASLGRGPELLAAGVRDLGPDALRKRVAPFFRAMDGWMGEQTQAAPAALSREDLRELSAQISNAIDVLDEPGTAAALGHLDLNPGNLVASAQGTVFLDWAEAFVGHPFLAFQYFAQLCRRACGENAPLETQLLAIYLSSWRPLLSDAITARALAVAPLAAVFALATASEPWSDPIRLGDPGTGSYLRSLTRRMYREARLLSERSLPCPE
jgi:hypothetical protein